MADKTVYISTSPKIAFENDVDLLAKMLTTEASTIGDIPEDELKNEMAAMAHTVKNRLEPELGKKEHRYINERYDVGEGETPIESCLLYTSDAADE